MRDKRREVSRIARREGKGRGEEMRQEREMNEEKVKYGMLSIASTLKQINKTKRKRKGKGKGKKGRKESGQQRQLLCARRRKSNYLYSGFAGVEVEHRCLIIDRST